MGELEQLYQEIILTYADTRGGEVLDSEQTKLFDKMSHQFNTVCGDDITVYANFTAQASGIKISNLNWSGSGCSISIASVCILCEMLVGKNIDEAFLTFKTFKKLMDSRGDELDETSMEILDNLSAFTGVAKFPARIKCALLAWEGLNDILLQIENEILKKTISEPKEQDRSLKKNTSNFEVLDMNPADFTIIDENRDKQIEHAVLDALHNVYDPEINIDIVNLGLIYDVKVDDQKRGIITATLTSPACPLNEMIEQEIAFHVEGLLKQFKVQWTFNPPWSIDKATDDGKAMLNALGWNTN